MIKNIGIRRADVLARDDVVVRFDFYLNYDNELLVILLDDTQPIGGVLCSNTVSEAERAFEILAAQFRNRIVLTLDDVWLNPNKQGYALVYNYTPEIASDDDTLVFNYSCLSSAIASCKECLNFFCRDGFLLSFMSWVEDLTEKTVDLIPVCNQWQYMLLSDNPIARGTYLLYCTQREKALHLLGRAEKDYYHFSDIKVSRNNGTTVMSRFCAVGQYEVPDTTEFDTDLFRLVISWVDTTAGDRLLNIDLEVKPHDQLVAKSFDVILEQSGEGLILVNVYPACVTANLVKPKTLTYSFKLKEA